MANLVRASGCLASLAFLSACAGGQHISASQEAARYEQQARRSYVAPGSARDPWGPYITEASARFDVPERWIREVMRVESGGHTELNGQPITSGAGAMGLMQVMPATYDELRGRYDNIGSDPYDPHNSILAGTAYIRELYDLYGSPGFLAAYNGGPGRLDDYLTRDRPLPDETRRYVAKIGPYITDSFPAKRSMAEMYAMNGVPAAIPAGPRYSPATDTAAPVPAEPAAVPPAVEVAFAPPAADGAFDPPPGWKPPNMPPAETAAYVPPPGDLPPPPPQVAAAPPRMPAPAEMASLPEPPVYTPPAPPAYVPPAYTPRVQTATSYEPPAPAPQRGFRLVAPAMAAPVPAFHTSPGQWAIQVGAFGNEGLAHIAVGQAREQGGALLAAAHPVVAGVREPHGTLYRARLTGLSRDTASQACERIRSKTNCIVLSPEAQS